MDNRLKSWEKDLENSVENYKSSLSYFNELAEKRLLAPGDVDTMLEVEKRLREVEKELTWVQWMIRIEEGLEKKADKFQVENKDKKTYWQIAEDYDEAMREVGEMVRKQEQGFVMVQSDSKPVKIRME